MHRFAGRVAVNGFLQEPVTQDIEAVKLNADQTGFYRVAYAGEDIELLCFPDRVEACTPTPQTESNRFARNLLRSWTVEYMEKLERHLTDRE